jgi:4-hydroxyphenylpyruvate dioxygenase
MTSIQAIDERNPLGIRGIDHLVFYVGNASQAAHYYLAAFGFKTIAYAGLETGLRDSTSWVLEQGAARIVVTSGFDPQGLVAKHATLHGDSVKDIAFRVDNAERAFEAAIRRGAHKVVEPTVLEDEHGQATVATVFTFGDTVHSFIERNHYQGAFLPGYVPKGAVGETPKLDITGFDHFAVSVNPGTLNDWIDFYLRVFGFRECHEENVFTSKSGMRSKVVRGESDDCVFPMMEPVSGAIQSQIQDYLNFNGGPGVQHAALQTEDIVAAVRGLGQRGVEFRYTPRTYYDSLPARVGDLQESVVEDLRELGVMVDRDDDGHLFQIFTKAVTGRPTFFIELIQRKGARGFGGGNIRALFEAVEREQAAQTAAALQGVEVVGAGK